MILTKKKGRVSLSLKATTPGPWDGVEQKLAKGDVVEGTVKRLTDFGAFVEVLPGIDGLVHVSQISHKRIENPKKLLKLVKRLKLKFLKLTQMQSAYHFLSKLLKSVQLKKKDKKKKKRAARPRRPKRQEKRDFELPETQTGFSMADLFGDIEL